MHEAITALLHGRTTRPLAVVAVVVVHLVILVLAIFTFPLWISTAFPRFRSRDLALKFVREFRGWSCDIIVGGAKRSAGG